MDNNIPASSPDGSHEKRASIPSGFIEVFTAPGKMFSTPFHKFAWTIPLAVIVIISLILGQFTRPIFTKDMAPIMLENIEKYKDRLPAEQYREMQEKIDEMIIEGEKNEFQFTYLLAAVGFSLLIMLLIAVIGQMCGNFIFAGKESFWMILNVVAFAALIGMMGDIVRGLLIISKGSIYVYTGLGIIKPINDSSFVYYLLRQIDGFTIWRIIVTCIGLGAIYKMKAAKFAYIIFPLWLIFIALIAGANLFTGGSIIY